MTPENCRICLCSLSDSVVYFRMNVRSSHTVIEEIVLCQNCAADLLHILERKTPVVTN